MCYVINIEVRLSSALAREQCTPGAILTLTVCAFEWPSPRDVSRATSNRVLLLRGSGTYLTSLQGLIRRALRAVRDNFSSRHQRGGSAHHGTQIQQGERAKSAQGHGRDEAWHAAQRRLGEEGDQSKAGDCNRAVRGEERWCARSACLESRQIFVSRASALITGLWDLA
jgi:hypothetical protein